MPSQREHYANNESEENRLTGWQAPRNRLVEKEITVKLHIAIRGSGFILN